MFQKLKQYKDLRDTAKEAQNVLSDVTVHADSAGGKVGVVMDGNQKILSIDIDDELMAPEHKEKVTKGIQEAIEKAMKKLQREMMMKMKSGELEMPDISNLS